MYLIKMKTFLGCDPSCKDCYGDGNDMCYNCATGYIMNNKKCIGIFFFFFYVIWNLLFY